MRCFTSRVLFGVALLSVTAVAIFSALADVQFDQFAFEVRLTSTTAGHAQLYYDRGAGLSEAHSAHSHLSRSDAPVRHSLPLPPGHFIALRFDPIDREGTVSIVGAPRIVARDGRTVRTLTLSAIQPVNQIQSLREHDGRLDVVTTCGADDPQLALHFSPPLVLSTAWPVLIRWILLRSLAIFLGLAGLLFVFDRLPLAPGQPWPARLRTLAARPPWWLTLAACALILYARKPDAFHNPQFWGEDSVIFYQQARTLGPAALTVPYASYLHAVPRLVAAASMWLDPRWAPTFFFAVALAGTLYVAARTQSTRCPLPRHLAFALAVVLVPDGYEVLLNVDNLQWFLAAGLVLLLISADPGNGWQYFHDGGVALLFGLTGPFSIVLAPLFGWRAWQRRTRASLIVAAFAIAAGAVQLWTVWHYPPAVENKPIDAGALLAVPGMRVVASLFAGCTVPMDYPRAIETLLGALALVGVAMLALRRGPARLERLWLALAFAGLLASSLYRCRYVLPHMCHATFGSRYFHPLQLWFVWLLLAAAAADPRRWITRAATIAALWCLAINLPRLRENPFVDLQWGDYAPKIRAGEAVDVPVNPTPWVMKLPAKKG